MRWSGRDRVRTADVDAMSRANVLVLCLALLATGDAVAQAAPAQSAGDLRKAAEAMDCAALDAMPRAPLTREACEAYKASGLQLGQAMGDAAGARPGDGAMTCDQIAAELQALDVTGVSAGNAAEAQAAAGQLRRTQQQAQSAAAAMAARQTAETAAAAATASNQVAGTVAMRQAAEQQALARRAGDADRAARSRAARAVAAASQDLAAGMRDNPRWAYLLGMAALRCSHHPVFNGSAMP